MPSLEEQEITTDEPFDAALPAYTKLHASVGWTDNWERDETLGEGEHGIVKPARHSTVEGKLAVKTLPPNEIQCLKREHATCECLNHPWIVGFEKYLPKTCDRPLEMVSEFVPNGDRFRKIFFKTISSGLSQKAVACRSRKSFLQCDISTFTPENILIDWEWIIRINPHAARRIWRSSRVEMKSDNIAAPRGFHTACCVDRVHWTVPCESGWTNSA
jgi:hypothetical protein